MRDSRDALPNSAREINDVSGEVDYAGAYMHQQ